MDQFSDNEKHYREFRRRNLIRLLSTYLAPLMLVIVFFLFQYRSIVRESHHLHLKAITESQANTLDLFLTERVVNLSNLIDDPRLKRSPSSEDLDLYLEKLKRNSGAFVDIGYFDSSGLQTAYAGPYPSLERRNYGSEAWFVGLKDRKDNFIITDIYLGFRQQPHFTIAAGRLREGQYIVMRAALSPDKIYEFVRSQEGAQDVITSIVNRRGSYQVVTPEIGSPLQNSSFVPPFEPRLGLKTVQVGQRDVTYAYSWLKTAEWALISQDLGRQGSDWFSGFMLRLMLISGAMSVLLFLVIVNRSGKLVAQQKEADQTRAQLGQAAKLASIGELAAGIAHEINNPLAVITEEAGLVKDLMNPEFGITARPGELQEHLDNIQESAFRCRDITHRLLGFVRQSELDLRPQDIRALIDGVIDDLLGPEIVVSNIRIVRTYAENLPQITTDGNRLQQVFLNVINNAVDAIEGQPGTITISTRQANDNLVIDVADTGKGIPPEHMERLFLPFFTTKQVGKGTGLGLSVSYGIIKQLGGSITVASEVDKGTTLTISLPVK